jgi:hypothetical protein
MFATLVVMGPAAFATAALTDEIDHLIGALGRLGDVHESALTGIVCSLHREQTRLAAIAAAVTARWEASGAWADNGALSTVSRLTADTRSSRASCGRDIRRARVLRSMPATQQALFDGRITFDHVDLLANAAQKPRHELFAEAEDYLVDACARLGYRAAARAVSYWIQRADAALGNDGPGPGPDPTNRVHTSTTSRDQVRVDGLLDAVGGAVVTGELDRLIADLRQRDRRDGVERTLPQLRAAALVEMATRSAARPDDASTPRPLFTVLIGEGTLAHLCELADGTVIDPRRLADHIDTALLEIILFGGPRTVLSVSHRRTFTGALRRAVQVRDRQCQHPSGCEIDADRCDVDHIVPYGRGGPTHQHNARLLCTGHNRIPGLHPEATGPPAGPAPPHPVPSQMHLEAIRARLRWRAVHADHD